MPSPIDTANARERRKSIVAYIAEFARVHGYGPSRTELASVYGVSLGTIAKDLSLLRDGGLVTWSRNRQRSLRLIN